MEPPRRQRKGIEQKDEAFTMLDDLDEETCDICGLPDDELYECMDCGKAVCYNCSVQVGEYRKCQDCLE